MSTPAPEWYQLALDYTGRVLTASWIARAFQALTVYYFAKAAREIIDTVDYILCRIRGIDWKPR